MTRNLKTQANRVPTRKVRWGAYVVAGLTIATYVVGVFQGNEIVSGDAVLDSLKVLAGGASIIGTEYAVRDEA